MTLEGDIDVQVQVARETDEPTVTFAFAVTNTGAEPIEVQFSDACRAEFVVERAGTEIWRFTDGRMFAQVLGTERLAPDETVVYDAEWAPPQEGTYTVTAQLAAREATCEAATTFEV